MRLPVLIMHWPQSVPSCFLGSIAADFTAPDGPTFKMTVTLPTERFGFRRSAVSMQASSSVSFEACRL